MDSEQHEFERIYADDAAGVAEIVAFLHRNELNIDDFIEVFLAARNAEGAIIACGGVAPGVIKCVAIDEEYRGCGMALSLSSALIQLAAERGYHRLFIYTKPENEALFSGCGFYPIATVPERVVLLENSPVRLKQYQQQLSALKKPGARIGSIVLNANPFTLGHLYLIETALQQCDWLHVFVVGEDRSQFSYADRLALVRAGTAHLSRLTIHEGTPYIISRATFPCYFLKLDDIIFKCHMELDLTIFRRYIAPPLGITHRFAGSEPYSVITNYYNKQMQVWLDSPEIDAPPIQMVEIPRKQFQGGFISATKVRGFLAEGDFAAIKHYVPECTYQFLINQYEKVTA